MGNSNKNVSDKNKLCDKIVYEQVMNNQPTCPESPPSSGISPFFLPQVTAVTNIAE